MLKRSYGNALFKFQIEEYLTSLDGKGTGEMGIELNALGARVPSVGTDVIQKAPFKDTD